MTGTTYGIVAGYDGSPGAAQALRWAAREACARGTTLTVCLAWTPDHMDLPTESALCDLARIGLEAREGLCIHGDGERLARLATCGLKVEHGAAPAQKDEGHRHRLPGYDGMRRCAQHHG